MSSIWFSSTMCSHNISIRHLTLLVIFCIFSAATTRISSALPIDNIFKLPSPLPTWPQGEGFGSGSIDLGGLRVSQVTTFKKIWATHGLGPDNLGITYFEPSPIPEGFFMLGGYAQPNNKALFGWVLVGQDVDGSSLRPPIGYIMFWVSNDLGIGQDGVGFFWLPIAPDGYKPVGYVVTSNFVKPSLDRIRCVRSDLTAQAEIGPWMFSGRELNMYEMRPKNRGVKDLSVSVGTFVAQYDWETPESPLSLSCLRKRDPNLSSMPNRDQITKLIDTYAPKIYFHPDEEFLPSSTSWYFSNGALLHSASNGSKPVPVNPDGSSLPQAGWNDGMFWLDLPADGAEKERVKKGDVQSSEAYIHAKRVFGATFTDLAMWVFYPFNGPGRLKLLLFTIPLNPLGEHIGDWEHVTLRISNFNGELMAVYFSQHSAGTWVRSSELEFFSGNRFVAYSSLHGHAFYPSEGLVLQGIEGLGLMNDAKKSDLVLDCGAKFSIVAVEYIDSQEPPWINYMRQWGPKIAYEVDKELEKIGRSLNEKIRDLFMKFLKKIPSELLGEEGPPGPKTKSSWAGDEKSTNQVFVDMSQLVRLP